MSVLCPYFWAPTVRLGRRRRATAHSHTHRLGARRHPLVFTCRHVQRKADGGPTRDTSAGSRPRLPVQEASVDQVFPLLTNVKYPEISVRLSGEDGDGFFIASRVRMALNAAGVSEEEREEFWRAER
jgi:hypothetical protein